MKLGLEVVDFFQAAERFEDFEALRLSNTGITLDVGHISFPNPLHPGKPSYHPYDRIGRFIERFGSRLLSLHIHDYDGKHDHQPLGTGRIDFEDILGSLREIRYNGLLCFEFSTSVKRADILRSRELLLKKMR